MIGNVKWEMFYDDSFYGMWAVRPIKDKDINSPRLFHFNKKNNAEEFKRLVEMSHCAVSNKKK